MVMDVLFWVTIMTLILMGGTACCYAAAEQFNRILEDESEERDENPIVRRQTHL